MLFPYLTISLFPLMFVSLTFLYLSLSRCVLSSSVYLFLCISFLCCCASIYPFLIFRRLWHYSLLAVSIVFTRPFSFYLSFSLSLTIFLVLSLFFFFLSFYWYLYEHESKINKNITFIKLITLRLACFIIGPLGSRVVRIRWFLFCRIQYFSYWIRSLPLTTIYWENNYIPPHSQMFSLC